jgi:hypothetical protein
MVLSAFALRATFGVFLPLASVARGALAAAIGFLAARLVPQHSFLFAPVAMAVGALAYLAMLFVLRELTRDDVDALLSALKKRKPAAPATA